MTAIQRRSNTVTAGSRSRPDLFRFYMKSERNEQPLDGSKSIPDRAISFEFWRKAANSIHKQKPGAKGQNSITSIKPWLKNSAIPKKRPVETPA